LRHPGALVLRPSGGNSNQKNRREELFAPTARGASCSTMIRNVVLEERIPNRAIPDQPLPSAAQVLEGALIDLAAMRL